MFWDIQTGLESLLRKYFVGLTVQYFCYPQTPCIAHSWLTFQTTLNQSWSVTPIFSSIKEFSFFRESVTVACNSNLIKQLR